MKRTEKNFTKRSSKASKRQLSDEERRNRPSRVFLYIHLKAIENLPWPLDTKNEFIVNLTHSMHTIVKLEDHYTKSTDVELNEFERNKPTFSITILQDSIEELNAFSDNPLIVTFFERIKPKSTDKRNRQRQVLIAQGCIDLLQFFCHKRSIARTNIFLYPISDAYRALPTIKTTWEIYTLLPLLKEISFSNIAFVTLESIYNAPAMLVETYHDLVVDLSFQAKILDEHGHYKKAKLSTFTDLSKQIIALQNVNLKWETLKDRKIDNINSLGIQSECKISTHALFHNLLSSEGVDFKFHDISKDKDSALICNSVHRYVLMDNLVRILEDVIAFNEQNILVEVYKMDNPNEILLEGIFDLSVFLYPKVNSCRFAVELHPVSAKLGEEEIDVQARNNQSSSKNKKRDDHRSRITSKTCFAIISLCFISPITETFFELSRYNENSLRRQQLKRCAAKPAILNLGSAIKLCEEAYQTFDDTIDLLINYIVEQQISSTDQSKEFFCCQLGNLNDKILKLIGCDFNRRVSTKSNIEFSNLMTSVYRELVERVYKMIPMCDSFKSSDRCFFRKTEDQRTIINFMSAIKFMYEVGNNEVGDFVFKRILQQNDNNIALNFFIFIYNTEKGDFEAAKNVYSPSKKKPVSSTYLLQLMDTYVTYKGDVEKEESYNQALEKLLISLTTLSASHPKDTSVWVLLHCIFKICSYSPGVSFTRWKYENLSGNVPLNLHDMPISRWAMYNNYSLNVQSTRAIHFYNVMKLFLSLGLYTFAEMVFNEFSNECTEVERYFVKSTFRILLNDLNENYTIRTFPAEKLINANEIKAFQAQVNGNLNFFRGNTETAMQSYQYFLDPAKGLTDYEDFQISLLRYAYQMTKEEQYMNAVEAFQKCTLTNGLAANFEIGRSLYRLNRTIPVEKLTENNPIADAEAFLAKCTLYRTHIPDVWGYLALINLKLGRNFKALQFWKYAKLSSHNVISEEILEELRSIDCKNVFLFVDL